MPEGWSNRDVARKARGAGGRTDQPELQRDRCAAGAQCPRTCAITDWLSHSSLTATAVVSFCGPQAPQKLGRALALQVEADAAGADQAAAEATSADEGGHVEQVAADAAAKARGRQEADVAGEGAQVADVVGEAFELERDASQGLGSRGLLAACERLADLGVGGGMADARVSGSGLGVMDRSPIGAAEHGLLDASMLVAQRDLEMEYFLAVALEPKMTRLDDAGVHGSHRDFVHLVALDPVEVPTPARRPPGPGRGPCAEGGFSQGCPRGSRPNCSAISRSKACAWGHCGRHRGKLPPGTAARDDREGAAFVVGEDGEELDALEARGPGAEHRRDAHARGDVVRDGGGKFFER